MLKRIISLTMCLAMLLLAMSLVGCKKEIEEEAQTSEYATVETVEGDTYVAPDVNYNGMDFNVMTWSWCEDWVLSVDEGSSAIDSQTYYHLKNVEREIGIKFNILRCRHASCRQRVKLACRKKGKASRRRKAVTDFKRGCVFVRQEKRNWC